MATLTGALQAAYFDALPDVVLRGVAEVLTRGYSNSSLGSILRWSEDWRQSRD